MARTGAPFILTHTDDLDIKWKTLYIFIWSSPVGLYKSSKTITKLSYNEWRWGSGGTVNFAAGSGVPLMWGSGVLKHIIAFLHLAGK